jgi:lipopolysaccharide export system permease protein
VKKLHIFIVKSFFGPFLLTFFVVIFVLLMQFLWKYIDDLAGKGLDFSVLAELLLYTSAGLVPMALPLATLLSSLMTFGNLGENYELIALKSAGISLQRIMFPLFMVAIVITMVAFVFANYMLPITNLKMRSLLFDIQQKRPEMQIKEGVFYNGITGYSVRIGDKDYKTNLLKNVYIYDHTQNKANNTVTYADSGYMRMSSDKRTLLVTLYNANSYNDLMQRRSQIHQEKAFPFRRDHFGKQDFSIQLVGFDLNRTDEGLFKSSQQMLNLRQLTYYADSLGKVYSTDRGVFRRSILSCGMFKVQARKKDLKRPTTTNQPCYANIDSAMGKLSIERKRSVYSTALTNARQAKERAENETLVSESQTTRIRKYEIEWHRKFTLSLACLIFFMIGAPLGAIIRKGGIGMPVVVSVLFFVLYYVLSMMGEKFVKQSVVSAAQGMWFSAAVLIPLGLFLAYKATTDSSIMSSEAYMVFFNRIKTFWAKLSKARKKKKITT